MRASPLRHVAIGASLGLLWAADAGAQLVLDSSLVPAGEITPVGNEYQITDELGVFSAGGENRYHSFSQFDMTNPNQTAVFSSLATPERVIVRVTQSGPFGGSVLNGTIRSTIPGADLYFLNPFGVFFGTRASIDVDGSFYASSADVLRFPEGPGADLATGSLAVPTLLSVSAPARFGFTSQTPGPISSTSSTRSLAVPAGETLSFIGGEVTFQSFGAAPNVRAPGATVQIAAVAGPAEIPTDLSALDPSALPPAPAGCPGGGCVTLASGSEITVTSPAGGGAPAGEILIRGGRFVAAGGDLTAVERDLPGGAPGAIDIAMNGAIEISDGSLLLAASESLASGPDIRLAAPIVSIDGGRVASEARGAGDGGAITIDAQTLRITNESERAEGSFVATSAGDGRGGDLTVRAANVELLHGGQLRAETVGTGDAGDLRVIGADTVHLAGIDALARPSGLTSRASEDATGAGGDLRVETRTLSVEDGAQISAATFGAGSAGDLSIAASESVTIRGGANGASVVSAASRQIGTAVLGPSGDLTIEAPSVVLADGGQVSVSTAGPNDAGDLTIAAADVTISGVDPAVGNQSGLFAQSNSLEQNAGAGGDITVSTTRDITVADGGRVSVITLGGGAAGQILLDAGGSIRVAGGTVGATTSGAGQGGQVTLVADRDVSIVDGGVISARSLATGTAGDLLIDAGQRVELARASITTEAQNADGGRVEVRAGDTLAVQDAQITTSVLDGTGGGGDVTVDAEFVILDSGDIIARAVEGNGGNIRIRTGTFLPSTISVVDASSKLGISGTVVIDSPNPELSSKLVSLPQSFLNASALLADPCLARTASEGSFVVHARGALPPPDAALTPESGEPACTPAEEM